MENRLFSEGLHVLGEPPSPPRLQQYLQAYFDESLPAAALEAVSGGNASLEQVKERLERSLDLVSHGLEAHNVSLHTNLEASSAASTPMDMDVDWRTWHSVQEIRRHDHRSNFWTWQAPATAQLPVAQPPAQNVLPTQ